MKRKWILNKRFKSRYFTAQATLVNRSVAEISELKLKDVSYDGDGMGITSHELRMRKLISNVLMTCDRRQIHSFNVLVHTMEFLEGK